MKVALVVIYFAVVYYRITEAKPIEDPVTVEGNKELQVLETQPEKVKPCINLKELFDRFFVLVDEKKLMEFLVRKLTEDVEAQNVFRYLKGEKAKAIVRHLTKDPEYIKLIKWFYDNGMTKVYDDLKEIYVFFGWNTAAHSGKEVVVDAVFAQSLQSLLEEFLEVLPMNAMATLAMELYQSGDPAAVSMLQRFREPGMVDAWHKFKMVPEVKELGQALVEGGVALEIFVVIIEAFFGWA